MSEECGGPLYGGKRLCTRQPNHSGLCSVGEWDQVTMTDQTAYDVFEADQEAEDTRERARRVLFSDEEPRFAKGGEIHPSEDDSLESAVVIQDGGVVHNHDLDPSCREYRDENGHLRGECQCSDLWRASKFVVHGHQPHCNKRRDTREIGHQGTDWSAEREDVLGRFYDELAKATGDGSKKRQAGTKPPWFQDQSHEGAIFSHLTKWKRGELEDDSSGAHPLVHLAWRALAIACQETGNVPSLVPQYDVRPAHE